ncbi:hypothetical protein EI42_01150 [Thermosporothrix hazakensis]|jgi:hypothetical protein|uniref:Leucine rich repeat (LRR) protein n=1 Tax=Thermosporothrix hazakensis TaxID=644383 RepID=A0A326ULY3_THEHA|nr:hypothetical protein [Thermosporothrix hazakensis]PZW34313.1 hypothetical protein EI42_01150 [Thermosporothrix hazakensis]GCE46135.1 hypothetical protein KTH_10040 [Thermosporothrix hazakensis]
MGTGASRQEFSGKRVIYWEPGTALTDTRNTLYCIRINTGNDPYSSWAEKFDAFLQTPGVADISGLVVGNGSHDDEGACYYRAIVTLVAARQHLSGLTTLRFGDGDIRQAEEEPFWIEPGTLSSLLAAYPALDMLCISGTNGIRAGLLSHERLRTLIIESSGLDARIVHEVQHAHLPALEHLELWTGLKDWGCTTTLADLAPLLSARIFPHLRSLGLRACSFADDVACMLAQSPLLAQLHRLDLSLGTLGDRGAEALLRSPMIHTLKELDIHHHFCSQELVTRLQRAGMSVDSSEPQPADKARFIGLYV